MGKSPAFQAALAAIIEGTRGVYLVGDRGAARSAWVGELLAAVPPDRTVIAQLGATSTPDNVAAVLAQAMKQRADGEKQASVLIVVDNAERLYNDTLDVLNEVAALLEKGRFPTRLLLVGSDAFTRRMAEQEALALLNYLSAPLRIDLAPIRPEFTPVVAAGEEAGVKPIRSPITLRPTGAEPVAPVRRGVAGVTVALAALAVVAGSIYLQSGTRPSPAMNQQSALLVPAPAPPASPQTTTDLIAPPTTPTPQESASAADAGAAHPDPASSAQPLAPANDARSVPAVSSTAAPDPDPSSMPQPGRPGLMLVARRGDTLQRLYRSVYNGVKPPPYRDVLAANPNPVQPGAVLVFPTPPNGWAKPPS